MKRIISLMLCVAVLFTFNVSVYASTTPEAVEMPSEPSESISEPETPEEPETPSESNSEAPTDTSEPEAPGEPEAPEEPSSGGASFFDMGTPTVNISDESVQAIADAVISDGYFSIDIGGVTYKMVLLDEDSTDYYNQQGFLEAWNTYDYKVITMLSKYGTNNLHIYFFEELPNEADYVDSSGKWMLRNAREYCSGGIVTSFKTITIKTWSNINQYACEINPDLSMWSNFNVIGQGGVVLHESDIPLVNWVNFETGFDDLVIDPMTTNLFNAPVPVYEGYKFDGWFLDEEFTQPYTPDYVFVGDTTLYAKWIPYVTITLVTGIEDFTIEPVTMLSGDVFNIPGYSYPEYRFVGAFSSEDYTAESQFQSGTIVTEDMTLYLRFEPLDTFALMEMMVDRLEGMIYVQTVTVVLFVAFFVSYTFYIRRCNSQ